VTNINLSHVLALERDPWGACQITGILAQHINLGIYHPHWSD